jgi:hypothetical protein
VHLPAPPSLTARGSLKAEAQSTFSQEDLSETDVMLLEVGKEVSE